ncbi:MAG: hypothetical protein ACJAWW_002823 [Sulfurimonas sp.]|jgi:hypothetical protein
MEIDISTWMLIFFVVLFSVSIWKVYILIPNKQLADDDTTKEAQEELLKLVLKVIKQSDGELNHSQLFENIKNDEGFDGQRFWRFNQNKLNQLLDYYHLQNPNTSCIKDIYHNLKA